MNNLYPVYLDIAGRKITVIGGGRVATRKVEVLLGRQARVTVVSPEITDDLHALAEEGRIELHRRPYRKGDLKGSWLVIASTENDQVNRAVFAEASENNIFCNVVDVPPLCSFQVPSIVRRGDLQIAVSTGGASPALAKKIRRQLQQQFDEHYETYLADLAELREFVKQKYPGDQPRRAALLEEFVNSDALDLLRRGDRDAYNKFIQDFKK